MSGGSLDYFCFTFEEPLEKISKTIKWGKNKWSNETLSEFQNAVKYLKIAQVYSRRIEWLLSGDDVEDSFHKRLKEELEELNNSSDVIEPQLQKCSLCQNFNGNTCKYSLDLSYRYIDHPEWEQIDKERYEQCLTDASDCWSFEEILEESD